MSSETTAPSNETQPVTSIEIYETQSQHVKNLQHPRFRSESQGKDLVADDIPVESASPLKRPTVTIYDREKALTSSEIAARQESQLQPFELSFWSNACVPGHKLAAKLKDAPTSAHGVIGYCVAHRRWDVLSPKPGDRHWRTTWWISGFVATNVFRVWQAEALSVMQALKMAASHCEQVSGSFIQGDEHGPCMKRIAAPMPTLINIFSENTEILQSFGSLSDPTKFPKDNWLSIIANEVVGRLYKYNVRINYQWVPKQDKRLSFASEGARLALNPRLYHPKVYRKQTYRVFLKTRCDRSGRKRRIPRNTPVDNGKMKQEMAESIKRAREIEDFLACSMKLKEEEPSVHLRSCSSL